MIKRIIISRFPLIVNSPAKVFDLNYFKAVHDAGGLPLFDTEYFSDEENIKILNQLKDLDILFSARVTARNHKLIQLLNENNITNLDLIVFSYSKTEELDTIDFNNSFYKRFIEIKDILINEKIEKLNVNGLILKGYEAKGSISKHTSFILMQWYLEFTNYPVFIYGGIGIYSGAGVFAAGANGCCIG